MKLFGIDFTSSPSQRKPITVSVGEMKNSILYPKDIISLHSFETFERFLHQNSPYIMAIDFPFSLPHQWLQDMNWPLNWHHYVSLFENMSIEEFTSHIKIYRDKQPKGKKYHLREIDKLAKSCSPMMIDYIPVGRMFFKGAPILKRSGAYIPIHQNKTDSRCRLIVEGYPALITRRIIGKTPYKSDIKSKQTSAQKNTRAEIMHHILKQHLEIEFGYQVDIHSNLIPSFINDPTGDKLDSLLCLLQATWLYQHGYHKERGLKHIQRFTEGWIADPQFM